MEFVHNGVLYAGHVTACGMSVEVADGHEVITSVPFEETWIETAKASLDGIYAMAA